MPLQRACGDENQVRNKLSNGPLRAQSNVSFTEYSATLKADVICRGYVGILLSAQVTPVNQGGTADKCLFVLDRNYISVRDFFMTAVSRRLNLYRTLEALTISGCALRINHSPDRNI